MKSLACCAALLCLWVSVSAQDDIQTIFDRINKEIIGGTYSARVEVTRATDEVKSTYTILEYHDNSTGLHSIEMTDSNTRKFFHKRLAGGKIFTVDADLNCKAANVEDAAGETEAFIYRSTHATEPEYFLGPTAVVIEMLADSMNYTGAPDEVRGIKANVYSNFRGRADDNKKSILIWFADNWDLRRLSATDLPFPIRVMITENNVTDQFDFYQVEDLSPKEAFRLGDHLMLPFQTVGCQIPKPSVEPPSLLSTFSFTSVLGGNIAAKEYFSIEDKLYRADGIDGSTVIHDDKHGLKYTLGNRCDVQPNPDVNPAILSSGSSNFGAQIVQAYLSLPNKVYIGEGFVSGMPADVWDALPADSDPNVVRARFFFAKTDSVMSANGIEGSRQLLKAMVLNSLAHDEPLDVDIYDFASSLGDLDFRRHFNIEACVEASMYVEFAFQADTTFNVEKFKLSNAMHELIEAVEENIEESTGVSFLQLPTFKAEVVDGNNVTVIAKILAPPPYLTSFVQREKMFNHYDGSPRDAPNEEDCARECILKKCPTFLYCGRSTCQLQKTADVSEWGNPSPRSNQDCYAYDHVPTTEIMERKTLQKITDILEKAVMELWPKIDVSMTEKRMVTLRAVGFYDHLTQFNNEGTLGPYTQQYTGSSIRDEHDSSVVVGGEILTVGQCYRECRNNKDIACSSFSICTGKKHCVLTSENINGGSSNDIDQANTIQNATQDCSIYSVNYLSEFDRLDGKTRKSGYIEHKEGSTAGDCAVRCRQEKLDLLEDCRSFDFCPRKKMCFFYRTHYNWDGGDDALQEGDCDHYSLRYSASYTAIGKGAFTGKSGTKVLGVSFEECAKQCSERSNGECKTISYCDSNIVHKPKETCYLYASDILELSGSNDGENTCTVYTQLVSYNDDLINPKRQIDKEMESNQIGMGDGAFAFLLIAMIAIGVVLGVAGWFQREKITAFIGRSEGSSTSSTTISYNRQDDEKRAEA